MESINKYNLMFQHYHKICLGFYELIKDDTYNESHPAEYEYNRTMARDYDRLSWKFKQIKNSIMFI